MTEKLRIASAALIVRQAGDCTGITCYECFCARLCLPSQHEDLQRKRVTLAQEFLSTINPNDYFDILL